MPTYVSEWCTLLSRIRWTFCLYFYSKTVGLHRTMCSQAFSTRLMCPCFYSGWCVYTVPWTSSTRLMCFYFIRTQWFTTFTLHHGHMGTLDPFDVSLFLLGDNGVTLEDNGVTPHHGHSRPVWHVSIHLQCAWEKLIICPPTSKHYQTTALPSW